MADSEEETQDWFDRKSGLMEELLGKENGMVMHAIIPYEVGGGLDLYYYPNGIAGTGIATKELTKLPGQGPSNDVFACYEMVMFSRHSLELQHAHDPSTPFGRAHQNAASILHALADHSAGAKLNPHATMEFPNDFPKLGGKCLVLDAYGVDSYEPKEFGLMVAIEVFRSEMEFARQSGTHSLLDRLDAGGYYPYSDLDREPVA